MCPKDKTWANIYVHANLAFTVFSIKRCWQFKYFWSFALIVPITFLISPRLFQENDLTHNADLPCKKEQNFLIIVVSKDLIAIRFP